MIKLEKIRRENIKDCLTIKVRNDQEDWVLSVPHALSMAYVYEELAKPFVIYHFDMIVGFVMLRYNKECNNYLLWQFMIDENYQSKGYGKAALSRVIDWVKDQPVCRELVVSYQDGNELAGRLYRDFGFMDMGRNEEGEVDLILRW